MAYTLKDGQGSLFKNDKEGNEARPDYRGELLIDGVLYRLSSWIKEGPKGKWMSLSASPKDERNANPNPKPREAGEDMEADIPF